MDRRQFIGVGASLAFALTTPYCMPRRRVRQPNILLIVADDLGYRDLGCYGSSFYDTPNLDRLATEGIRFTEGYASCPVCSPTRASLQTGRYPVKSGITDWIPGRQSYAGPTVKNRWKALPFENQLDLEEHTLAEFLRDGGYETFFAGKWHLGEKESFWPEHQGYRINKGGWAKGSPQKSATEHHNGYFSPYGNPRLDDGPDGEYLPDRLGDETIEFLEKHSDQPFFVCLSFYLVHTPLQAKKEDIQRYRRKRDQLGLDEDIEIETMRSWMNHATPSRSYKERVKQGHEVYAAMVRSMDENIGRILDTLKRLDQADDTVIVFTSDNGGLSTSEGSPTSNLPLRAGKGWLYEGGIRVPYIIKYPGMKNPGKISHMAISSIDVFPTLMSFANIEIPEHKEIDGVDLIPHMENDVWNDRPLFWHYPHYSNQGGNPGSAIRLGRYKLIDDFETGRKELYDLKEDVEESQDLASEMPGKTEALLKILDAWRSESGANMMAPNPLWDGIEPVY